MLIYVKDFFSISLGFGFFFTPSKGLWLVEMLLCELLRRANPTQLLLKRITRRIVWEWPIQGSGFGNPLCFRRSLGSATFRCGHVDPLLRQCYKLSRKKFCPWHPRDISGQNPSLPLPRVAGDSFQSRALTFQAQLSWISQTTLSRGSVRPLLAALGRPQCRSSCRRKAACAAMLHREQSCKVAYQAPLDCCSSTFHCYLMCACSEARTGISTQPKEPGLPFFP